MNNKSVIVIINVNNKSVMINVNNTSNDKTSVELTTNFISSCSKCRQIHINWKFPTEVGTVI